LDVMMKQVYMITYPTGKIYIGKDSVGSFRYFGSPDMELVNADFQTLSREQQRDYTVRKQILWESEAATETELSTKEVGMILQYRANDPAIGYNRWPKCKQERVRPSNNGVGCNGVMR
jgi:hypothetical protein